MDDLTVPFSNTWKVSTSDPDVKFTIKEIIQENGFNFEQHQVTTEDGYKLAVMRVKNKNLVKGAPVVFLQHGLFSDATFWVLHKQESVAF